MSRVVLVSSAVTALVDTFSAFPPDGSMSPLAEAVAGVFADRENKRRVDLLVTGFEMLMAAEKDLKSINKPDVGMVTEEGTNRVAFFSDKRIGEVNKVKQKIDKLIQALNNAMEQANFDPLEKLVKNKDGKQEEQKD